MAVPVALGKSFFDTTSLKEQHTWLSSQLVRPAARDAMDPSQDMIFSVTVGGVDRKFVVYSKSFYDKAGDAPTVRFFFKDDTNTEREFPSGLGDAGLGAVTMVGLDSSGNTVTSTVTSAEALVVNPKTGEICENSTAGNILGHVKFEAVTGLEVAQINSRLSDINNALEGLTKVLTILNSNMDAGISLIR